MNAINTIEFVLRIVSYLVFGITPVLIIAMLTMQNAVERVYAHTGSSIQSAPFPRSSGASLRRVRILAVTGIAASLVLHQVYVSLFGFFR